MRDALEITLSRDSFLLRHPSVEGSAEYQLEEKSGLGDKVAQFCSEKGLSVGSVVFYVTEELLYFKSFGLPVNTPDLKDAVQYQLGLLTPFDRDAMLYAYSAVPEKEMYRVNLYAVQTGDIENYLEEVTELGGRILGLYPESQRYVGRSGPKKEWVLVMPGRFYKSFLFQDAKLKARQLCLGEPAHDELAKINRTDEIYHCTPPPDSAYKDAASLDTKPLLKDFNMLPQTYRRPDYLRHLVVILLVMNVIAFLVVGGIKGGKVINAASRVEQEISNIMPQVREVAALEKKEVDLRKAVEVVKDFQNPDLINFLGKLTAELPDNSYLDLIRLDKDQEAIRVMGYTENVGDLTLKLQALGDTKLKSTSRRKNQTYFHVEITPQ